MRKFITILLLTAFFFPLLSFAAVKPINILIVPGHDDEVWGAQYRNLKEADMNLILANKLYDILKKDKRFKVYISRDQNGYTKTFADYFKDHRADIILFKNLARKKTQAAISAGEVEDNQVVPHNPVNQETSIKLYGINKWANDNNMDAVIHVHFNDYPRANMSTPGKYRGFAIYLPEAQLPNSFPSASLAVAIFNQLKKNSVVSNFPLEKNGLIPDQKLIALGSNSTLSASVRSVLVEYGYIYRFGKSGLKSPFYQPMAELTAKGIKNYFFVK